MNGRTTRDTGDRRGQVAAIAGVLAVAAAVVLLASAQAFLVPQQNERTELDHLERTQADLADVRTAILDSARTSAGQTSTIDLGPEYRNRFVLQNPAPPSGSFAIERVGGAAISNAVAVNPETRDFWSGATRAGYPVGSVVYEPRYNYVEGAGTTVYENSVLYTERDGASTVRSDHSLLDGTDLNLVFLDGSRSLSSARTVTLEPERLSASDNRVPVRSVSPGDPVVVRVPTELPESAWRELLADERVANGGHLVSPPRVVDGELVLELEGGVTYGLSMSRVGYQGSAPSVPAYLTVVDVDQRVAESGSSEITVEVRDRYNNPVSGVDLSGIQPQVGTLVGPDGDSFGEVAATTDESGRATFVYRSPENVPEPDVLSQFSVRAEGIPGPKGEAEFEVGVGDTPEPVSLGERRPLVTAVQPDPDPTLLGDPTDLTGVGDPTAGEFVRVDVPAGFDPVGATLDVENADRSVVNTVPLDRGGLLAGATSELYVVGEDDPLGDTESLADLLATPERERLDLYVVGPTVTDLAGFADARGLTDGDVVVRAAATGLIDGGLADADGDGYLDLLDDRRGTVLLRNADGVVTDRVSYRSGPAGTIDDVTARQGTDDGAESVALSFDRPTDLTDTTLYLDSNGVNESVPLGAFADDLGTAVSGPVYVVGSTVDREAFATERGVDATRVRTVTDLAGRETLAYPEDVLGADEGEVTLTVDGTTVDRYEYEDRAMATIDDAVPVRDGDGTDEYVALTFDAIDTTGWTLDVADGSVTETLDLSPLAGVTRTGRGPIYLVGDGVAPATFAAERGVPEERVVGLTSLATDLADPDVLTDGGATLTLRDTAGDPADTFVYDGDDGVVAGADPTRAGEATDEYALLEFGDMTDTTGWTLDVASPDGDVETVPLDGIAGVADGPVYVVGDGTDVDAFADGRGVDPSRVVPSSSLDGSLPADLLPADGATLALRDAAGRTADSLSYAGTVTTGEITAVSPVAGGDSTDEYTRLSFDRSVDTTDWTLVTASDGAGTVTYDLSTFASTTSAPGPVYLVGGGVDLAAFAETRGVTTDRVARFSDVVVGGPVTDALPDAGAELSMVRDDGVVVDRAFYGTETRPAGDTTVDIGEEGTDETLYRETDDNGDPIDTDRSEDWYYTDEDPEEGATPDPAGPVTYEEASIGADPDGSLGFDVTNEGEDDATVVGFAVRTDLAPSVDAGGARELVVDAARPGYANDPDGGFATTGVRYGFEAGGTDWDGATPVLGPEETASVSLGALTDADGTPVDPGSLVRSSAAEADLSVTLVLDGGTTETFHFRQRSADLAVNVTAEDEVVALGARATFEVTVSNRGPGRAAGPVAVADLPDERLDIVSATTSVGRYDADAGEWTLPDGLSAGETATLSVTTAVDDTAGVGETLPYGTAVTASGSPDDVSSNDADEATVTVGGADLVVTQTLDPDPVEQGETTTLTVTVENRGPADNGGPIVVSESLPDGLRYVSDTPSAGSYDPATGEWTIPELAADETVTLDVVARAELSEPTAVTARVVDTGPVADGDDSNDADTVTVTAGPCSDYVRAGEDVLLYETFETAGATDTERLSASAFSATGDGVGGVDSATAAPGSGCSQSAYHADGAGSLVSSTLDTAPYDQVVVGYWVREGDAPFSEDPQAGEDLFVEYRTEQGDWVEIESFNASADLAPADGSAFERQYVLPADAATHDEFALRFRQEAGDRGENNPDTVFDYWHVDDVYVLGSDATGELRPSVTDVEPVHDCGRNGDSDDDDCEDDREDDDDRDEEEDDDDRDEEEDDDDRDEEEDDGTPGSYEVTFGYESTYDRPVALAPGDENDLSPDRYDPDLPTTFAPGVTESAVVVPDLEAGGDVTWTLADGSATAYGRVADLAVSMTTDDADGSIIEGQDLTYEVTVTSNGDQSGRTSGDVTAPVVLDVAIPTADETGSLPVATTSADVGRYDADAGEWTLPDGLAAGESATLRVTVRVETTGETTSAAEIARRATTDTVPENDRDTLTIDPYPVTCRDVAYVAPDGRTVKVLTPRGDTRTLGVASDTIDILGPYTNLDDDPACEAVYIAGGDDTEDNLRYLDDDGSERPLAGGADVSDAAIGVADLDGDGTPSVLYALGDSDKAGDEDHEDDDGGDGTRRKAISFVAVCTADGDGSADDVGVAVTEWKDDGEEPVAVRVTSETAFRTLVLKAGPNMEAFGFPGGSTGETAAVGEGSSAPGSPPAPCVGVAGESLVKFEWEGGEFEREADDDDEAESTDSLRGPSAVDSRERFALTTDAVEEPLYAVEAGEEARPVRGVGDTLIPTDSGGVGRADVTGDGVPDTVYLASSSALGIVDGATGETSTVDVGDIDGRSNEPLAIGVPRPVDGAPARVPVFVGDDLVLVSADGSTETVVADADAAPARFTLRDWDRDGQWEYLFVAPDGRVRVYDPGTGRSAPLTESGAAQAGTGVQ